MVEGFDRLTPPIFTRCAVSNCRRRNPEHKRDKETTGLLSNEEIVDIAEDLLAKRYGGTQKLTDVEQLGGSGSASVLRTRVASSPFLQQRSVVLKYLPRTGDMFDNAALVREIVSYQFTTSLSEDVRPGPVLLAYDIDKRIMVLSDSGHGDTFAELLDDPDKDLRIQILRNLGQALGSLHASTAGREADFDILLARMLAKYPETAEIQKLGDRSLVVAISVGMQLLAHRGMEIPTVVADFARDSQRRLTSGQHRAFTPFDLSPDNIIVAERTHFLDYELAGFRDATFDVACVIAGFPQFVFARPITDDEADELVDSWVQEVRGIWPNVNNETRLHARIVTALIGWAMSSVALMYLGSVTELISLLSSTDMTDGKIPVDVLENYAVPLSDEEDRLVRRDLYETFEALARFAGRGNDPRFPEVARFAQDVADIVRDPDF